MSEDAPVVRLVNVLRLMRYGGALPTFTSNHTEKELRIRFLSTVFSTT